MICARCGQSGAGLRYGATWWNYAAEQRGKICGADVGGVISTGTTPPQRGDARMVSSASDSLYPDSARPASEEKAGR